MPRLTRREVEAAPTRATEYSVSDDQVQGFALRVLPSGRKVFTFRFQLGGRSGRVQRVTIGDYGALTPDQARREAVRLRGEVAQGRDPAAELRAKKATIRGARSAPTVAELADDFLSECAAKLKPRTVDQYRRLIGMTPVKRGPKKGEERTGELRREFGRHKVSDVTRAQVAQLHLSMKDRPVHANRALTCLSAFFSFAERHGHRPDGTNPCRRVVKFREEGRKRYLSDAEIVAIGVALRTAEREGLPIPPAKQRRRASDATKKHRTRDTDADGARRPVRFSPVSVAVIRFLLLSGWREGEALTLEWGHVDMKKGVVILPDSKTGQSVRELGAPALEVLSSMKPERQRGNPYVFPGAKHGAHYTDTARVWYAVRHAAGLDDVRLHDLRHSFASVGAAAGLTLPLIGAMLGHTDSATTARYAHLTQSNALRRAADATSGTVAALLDGERQDDAGPSADVLPFPRRAGAS